MVDLTTAPYRSEAETQIARLFGRYGILFTYEAPVAVMDRGKTRIWHPDFHLRDLGVYIEYNGLLHDRDYTARVVRKQRVYADNGLTVLQLTPHDLGCDRDSQDGFRRFAGNWPGLVLERIEQTLVDRLDTWRTLRPRK